MGVLRRYREWFRMGPRPIIARADVYGCPELVAVMYEGDAHYTYYRRSRLATW